MPFSCFLFRPRKSRERRRKCSHTNVSNTLVTRTSTPSAQTALRSLSQAKAGTHSAFGEKSHTAARTAKQGVFWVGWYHYPRSVPRVLKTLRGRGLKRQTLPLLGLGRGYSRRTQRASGTAMRLCASLSRRRRGPAGLCDSVSALLIMW